jgi:hypothetical protein
MGEFGGAHPPSYLSRSLHKRRYTVSTCTVPLTEPPLPGSQGSVTPHLPSLCYLTFRRVGRALLWLVSSHQNWQSCNTGNLNIQPRNPRSPIIRHWKCMPQTSRHIASLTRHINVRFFTSGTADASTFYGEIIIATPQLVKAGSWSAYRISPSNIVQLENQPCSQTPHPQPSAPYTNLADPYARTRHPALSQI